MYLTRQVLIKEKYAAQSKYFEENIYNDYNKKLIIIDESNVEVEKYIPSNFTYQNLKYHSLIDNYEKDKDIIIINPSLSEQIDFEQREVIERQYPQLPIEQRIFLNDDSLTQEQILHKIYKIITKQLSEEKDILIYCADGNEIEYFRVLFEPYQIRLIVQIDSEFNELSQKIFGNVRNYTNTIYLLLEPQQLENANVTLIIHTLYREIISKRDDNVIVYSQQQLSLVDLQIREISKSNNEAVMIYYAFSEQQYFQMSKYPQKSINQQNLAQYFFDFFNNLDKHDKNKNIIKFGILIASLLTSGQLLNIYNINSLNKQLSIKTSQYWNRLGDYLSQYNIIMQIVSLINNNIEKKQQGLLKKFCLENKVNLIKALQIISKLKQFSISYKIDELDLLDELKPLELVKQSSSIDQYYAENEDIINQIFPLQKEYSLNKSSIQKIFKLNVPCYVLGIRDEQIIYSVIAESIQRKASIQEHQIQNVCSAVMDQLWSGEDSEIQKLENSLKCIIEPFNGNNIIIYGENSKQVESILIKQIQKIKEQLKEQKKEHDYLNLNIRFVLSNGASIYKCYFSHDSIIEMSNLSSETTEKDIRKLIEPYSQINSIQLTKQRNFQRALINLGDKSSVQEIIQDLDETEFQDHIIRIHFSKEQTKTQRKFQPYLIKLQWFIYNCKGSTEVTFENSEDAEQFYKQFNGTFLDGQQMKFQILNNNTIQINNLNQFVTELDIQRLSNKIKEILFQKTIIYEPKYDVFQKVESLLQEQAKIHSIAGKYALTTRISNSKKNYKRILKLALPSSDMVNSALSNCNNSLIQIGLQQVKLYCEAQYKRQFIVKQDLIKFIRNNIKTIQQKYQNMFQIKQMEHTNTEIILIMKTNDYLVYTKVGEMIQNIVEGYLINFDELNSILFSDFGSSYLQELELIQNVVFNVDKIKKIIKIYCLNEQYEELKKNIKQFLQTNTTITITLTPQKLKKLIGIDTQGLQYILEKYQLTEVTPNRKTNSLKLSGQAAKLEFALKQIEAFLTSQNDTFEQNLNDSSEANCNYCLMYMQQPYILTNCGHKLCLECFNFDFSNSIKDINSLPIKCPICQEPVLLDDILNIIGDEKYQKLVEISIIKYINENRDQLIFCFSQGCSNILQIKGRTATCEICKNTFCLNCKVQMHYGLTCWEFKTGDQKIMAELMKKEDIRFCPNCNSLAQKISGCMSVQCSGCKKYICWKNGKNDKPCMKIFNGSTECHTHLTDVHGGYY